MLTTLIPISGGRATIQEFDVVKQEKQVRLQIGVALQDTGIDEDLTGLELLVLQGNYLD